MCAGHVNRITLHDPKIIDFHKRNIINSYRCCYQWTGTSARDLMTLKKILMESPANTPPPPPQTTPRGQSPPYQILYPALMQHILAF